MGGCERSVNSGRATQARLNFPRHHLQAPTPPNGAGPSISTPSTRAIRSSLRSVVLVVVLGALAGGGPERLQGRAHTQAALDEGIA